MGLKIREKRILETMVEYGLSLACDLSTLFLISFIAISNLQNVNFIFVDI